ncbi:BTAD domain-containing putative transcriptional regulator [Catellatospora citrea]|uniref:AfsR/SARP family transcriptional regulator n=1 Tax=Catellatospora citrea TaxID=53366 RepID=UPI0033E8F660
MTAMNGQEDHTPTALMPRRVLALLVLRANQMVPVSAVIEELWEERSPRLARKTVQTYIYQLRKCLELSGNGDAADGIVSRPQGYQLTLKTGQLDLWRFECLADTGRKALRSGAAREAAELLSEALNLWRGRPIEDVAPGPLLAIETTRLDTMRLGVLEERIHADLAVGRHQALIGELEALTAHHPLHEEFYAQLMIAAHRSGRRHEALQAYRRLRRRMIDDLGLEPGPRVQQLHQEVLAEAPTLDRYERPESRPAPPAAAVPSWRPPAQLPPDLGDFVGREAETDAVVQACAEGEGDTAARVVVLLGQAAAGKTTLAVHAAHRLRARFPDGQMFATLTGPDGSPVAPADVLASLLSGVGEPVPASLEDRVRAFRTVVADRRILLVLDDATSVEQVLPLLPGGARCAVLITSQVRLPGLAVHTTVEVGPLEPEASLALLSAVIGADRVAGDHASAARLVALCEHLPFAVRAAGEKLAARPVWSLAKFAYRLDDEQRRLAELCTLHLDVRHRLLTAYWRLEPAYREAMQVLCRIGAPRFDLVAAGRVLGVDPLTAECPVGRLEECHLLWAEQGPSGRAWFVFPQLIRLAVLELPFRPVVLPKIIPAQRSPLLPVSWAGIVPV